MSQIYLAYTFKFDAAHRLLNYVGPCNNLHGHTWKVEVVLRGTPNKYSGMLIDFRLLKLMVNDFVAKKLDHTTILNRADTNLIESLVRRGCTVFPFPGEPTCENLAQFIFLALLAPVATIGDHSHVNLKSVRVWESENASAIYTDSLRAKLAGATKKTSKEKK